MWPTVYIISLAVLMFSCGAVGWFLRMRQELKQLAIAEEAMADYYTLLGEHQEVMADYLDACEVPQCEGLQRQS